MITISLCMIVKNEAKVLARCLDSVQNLVDEIIIVDTGSTDKTKTIAQRYTNKIYDFKWIDDFSAARNYAFSHATKNYQMWLDADDVITQENQIKILKLKATLDPSFDIVTFKYHTHFDQDNNPILTSTRGRLFKRSKHYQWNDPVHEYIALSGKIFYADDIFITHKKEVQHTERNLKIYEKQIRNRKKLSPRNIYYYARELKDNQRYEEAIQYFEQFLTCNTGWYEDKIATCYNLALCYRSINCTEKILAILTQSFTYDTPRAEITCEIGYYYLHQGDYVKALGWFLLTTKLEKPTTIGFVLHDYWNFIPYIELCVCYYQLGQLEKARYYHEIAKKYKPNAPEVLHNQKFFDSLQ